MFASIDDVGIARSQPYFLSNTTRRSRNQKAQERTGVSPPVKNRRVHHRQANAVLLLRDDPSHNTVNFLHCFEH